jgi:probable rRNA maturation factor
VRAFKFQLSMTAAIGREFVPFVRRNLLAARRLIRSPLCEVSIAFVGDRRMAALHRQFMNIDGPTDVLTFPLEADSRGKTTSGEVIVCIPEARRAAKGHRTSVRHEVLLYALHGILHLAGFDDRTESSFKMMHRMEDKILTRLGIGRVFAPAATRPPRRRRSGAR